MSSMRVRRHQFTVVECLNITTIRIIACFALTLFKRCRREFVVCVTIEDDMNNLTDTVSDEVFMRRVSMESVTTGSTMKNVVGY